MQFYGNFNISRFKADGVTPDPFTVTSEPASICVGGGGPLLIGCIGEAAANEHHSLDKKGEAGSACRNPIISLKKWSCAAEKDSRQ